MTFRGQTFTREELAEAERVKLEAIELRNIPTEEVALLMRRNGSETLQDRF